MTSENVNEIDFNWDKITWLLYEYIGTECIQFIENYCVRDEFKLGFLRINFGKLIVYEFHGVEWFWFEHKRLVESENVL